MRSKNTWALSIKQPWAWAILHAGKDIENRSWETKYRGEFLIHSAKKLDVKAPPELLKMYRKAERMNFPGTRRGGIIGKVTLTDCVTEHESAWFDGPYGFVLENPIALPFRVVRGWLYFFKVEVNENIKSINTNAPNPTDSN